MVEAFFSFVRALFAVLWAETVSRIAGPLVFRFILQPLVASAFAIFDGIRDARLGRAPHLAEIPALRNGRADRIREGLAVSRVLTLAIIVDLLYQYVALAEFRPLQALIVGLSLACMPYLLMRESAAHITRWLRNARWRREQAMSWRQS
jgi:hypothetical protein